MTKWQKDALSFEEKRYLMLLVLIALMRNKLLVTCWKTELFITFRLTFVTVQASCIKSDLMQECSPIVKSQVC